MSEGKIKVGDRVRRTSDPEIVGVVLSLHLEWMWVDWNGKGPGTVQSENVEATCDNRLLPCPLCGGGADLRSNLNGKIVECYSCGLTIRKKAKDQVVEVWNRRDW